MRAVDPEWKDSEVLGLWKFTTWVITGDSNNPRSSKAPKCQSCEVSKPQSVKAQSQNHAGHQIWSEGMWVIHLIDDVSYAMWQGCPVGTRSTWIQYLLDPNLFIF
jgi:hypothetical protein